MTDAPQSFPPRPELPTSAQPDAEDRTLPAVVYALYLVGLANGLTVLLGLILALANRDRASPRMRTHYTFLIRTCWLWLAWLVVGGGLVLWGALFSLILIGLPFLGLGLAILGLAHVWFGVRAIVGVIYLARDEPYPRPYAWIV
jgi:uncharacterized membrane protein